MANAVRPSEKAYWVVVADESSATIFTRETRSGPLHEWRALENEAGRKKVGELISDHGGRSFDSVGRGRHTMVREKSGPRTHATEQFAKAIAGHIGRAIHSDLCRGYVLVAPPRFLGQLREAMAKVSTCRPDKTIDKELVGHPVAELRKHIDKAS